MRTAFMAISSTAMLALGTQSAFAQASFSQVDADGDGTASPAELFAIFDSAGYLAEIDRSGDGAVQIDEIDAVATDNTSPFIGEMKAAAVDGSLSREKLYEISFAAADTDADGGVSEAEFVAFLKFIGG